MTQTTTPTTFTTPAPTFEDVWRALMEFKSHLQETERVMQANAAAAEKRSREMDKRMQELSKQIGGHANRLGEFVQEMVKPAAVRLFQERNLPVHQVISNHKVLDDNRQFVMEIDLIVINTDMMIALECKSKLTQEDVDDHLERLEKIKQYIPQYRNYTVLGGVAAMVIPETVSRYAHRNGLYVLSQSGDAVEIRNPSGFEAKEW